MRDIAAHLAAIQTLIGGPIAEAYKRFLDTNVERIRNEVLLLYPAEHVVERNTTTGVHEWTPELLAVGDDSGGRLVVIRHADPLAAPFLIDAGALVPRDLSWLLKPLAETWLAWQTARFPLPGWQTDSTEEQA